MKTHRKRHLPAGWYPDSPREAERIIQDWRTRYPRRTETFVAGVAPHAGWTFSGALAFAVMQQLPSTVDTVVVAGGHLPPGGSVLVAPEDSYETPLGDLDADQDLRGFLEKAMDVAPDQVPDNTVEVHLPIVRYLFDDVRCLSVRCPPSGRSTELAAAVAEHAESSGKSIAVIGSTDLTHYGPDYGFSPHGRGADALEWVEKVNDRRMIDALEAADSDRILESGVAYHAACSAGGANAASVFAAAIGYEDVVVIDHFTSHDVFPRSSFVGYAGVGYVSRKS